MKTFTVTEDGNLKDFTDAVYPQGSFAFAALLRARDIRVNGVKTGKNQPVKAGDVVTYYTTAAQEAKPSHRRIYADQFVYVADKFSGVSAEGLCSELNEGGRFSLVHRLDRNTAGVMILAASDAAERGLLRAFRERKIKKTYLCFCKNNFKKQADFLTAYLVKDERAARVKIYDQPVNGSAKILTEYRVIKRCGDYALVEIELHTGKTHQIRAHMAHIGCPVLGDEKYGDEALNAKYGVKRQLLVARRLLLQTDGELAYLNGKVFESEFMPVLP